MFSGLRSISDDAQVFRQRVPRGGSGELKRTLAELGARPWQCEFVSRCEHVLPVNFNFRSLCVSEEPFTESPSPRDAARKLGEQRQAGDDQRKNSAQIRIL